MRNSSQHSVQKQKYLSLYQLSRDRDKERQKKIYFKELAHAIVGTGKYEISWVGQQARNLGLLFIG